MIKVGTLWIWLGNHYTVISDEGNYLRVTEDWSGQEWLVLRRRDGSFSEPLRP